MKDIRLYRVIHIDGVMNCNIYCKSCKSTMRVDSIVKHVNNTYSDNDRSTISFSVYRAMYIIANVSSKNLIDECNLLLLFFITIILLFHIAIVAVLLLLFMSIIIPKATNVI